MAKKYGFKEMRRQTSFAWGSFPQQFSCAKRDFEIAKALNTEAVNNIENAIEQYKEREQAESHSQWQDLLCEASFGKGLSEGLLEMKSKTYRDNRRSFQELGAIVDELNNSYLNLTREPKLPENHLKVGMGLGRLGLAKEGGNMLECGAYWGKINDYLANRLITE